MLYQAIVLLLLAIVAAGILAGLTDVPFWKSLKQMTIVYAVLVVLAFLNALPDLLTSGALR